jgi:tetratricopeptide (TPR) repeat protein
MPSHIYVALGMWRDSIASNIAASAAADARRARKGLGVDARGYHSLAWLAYSYLQVGESETAARLLADMRRDERESGSKRARGALIQMRAAEVVAHDAWTSETAAFEVAFDGLEPATAGAELYVRGRSALARGNVGSARAALEELARQRGALESLINAGGGAQCCAPGASADYLPGRLAARVMELELSALIALEAGAVDEALAELTSAAEREDAMGYDFGPPAVVEPAHELLGLVYLRRARSTDAAREFSAALERAPGRAKSLAGLATARSAAP